MELDKTIEIRFSNFFYNMSKNISILWKRTKFSRDQRGRDADLKSSQNVQMWTSFWETDRFQYQPWSPWSILVFSLMPELISYADEREYLNWSSSHKICDYKIRSPEWKVTESVQINERRIWALCLGKSKRTKESERNNAMLWSLKFEDQCTDRPRGVCQERGQGAGTEGARLPFFRKLRCHPQLRIKGSAAPQWISILFSNVLTSKSFASYCQGWGRGWCTDALKWGSLVQVPLGRRVLWVVQSHNSYELELWSSVEIRTSSQCINATLNSWLPTYHQGRGV